MGHVCGNFSSISTSAKYRRSPSLSSKDPASPSWMSLLMVVCEAAILPVFAKKKQTVINFWRIHRGTVSQSCPNMTKDQTKLPEKFQQQIITPDLCYSSYFVCVVKRRSILL